MNKRGIEAGYKLIENHKEMMNMFKQDSKQDVLDIVKLRHERDAALKELANYKQLQRDYLKLVEDTSFRCPRCFGKLVWQSDHDMNDWIEEEGIVSFYSCPNCENIEIEVRDYDN